MLQLCLLQNSSASPQKNIVWRQDIVHEPFVTNSSQWISVVIYDHRAHLQKED